MSTWSDRIPVAWPESMLADANALSFTRTLWLVPLAAFVLREPIGPLRIGAALVGFVGFVVALISLSALRNFGPVLFYVGLAIFGAVGLVIAGAIMGAVV